MGYPMVVIQFSPLKSGQPLYSGQICWSQCILWTDISLTVYILLLTSSCRSMYTISLLRVRLVDGTWLVPANVYTKLLSIMKSHIHTS